MNLVLYTHRGLGLGQIFFWKHGCYNKCTSIILYLIQHHNIYAFKIMKIVSREFSASFRLKGYERSVTINLFSRQMISSSQIKVVNTLHKALASHHEIKTFCDKFVVFLGSIIMALAHSASNSGQNEMLRVILFPNIFTSTILLLSVFQSKSCNHATANLIIHLHSVSYDLSPHSGYSFSSVCISMRRK